MIIAENLKLALPKGKKSILTIGNFDGIHLGHQAILNRVLDLAKQHDAAPVVLTFINHPSTILKPATAISRLYSIEHKLKLLSAMGFEAVFLLPFTREFANQTAEEFITILRANLPFSHLILGHDATIGKGREGDKKLVTELAHRQGFSLEYLAPFMLDGEIVSSSLIRKNLQQGNLSEVAKFLGRPYSIYQKITSGKGFGMQIGSPTLNLNVSELCLPPLGVYIATVIDHERRHQAVANLGCAPTVRNDSTPILEAHLLDGPLMSHSVEIEVILHQYIRSEERFENIEDLKMQIAKDVLTAKNFHSKIA